MAPLRDGPAVLSTFLLRSFGFVSGFVLRISCLTTGLRSLGLRTSLALLQQVLQLLEPLLLPLLQQLVPRLVRVPLPRDLDEELDHVPPVGEVDVFRADAL